MTDRKTASTINDTELDQLYADLADTREQLRLTDAMRQQNLDAAAAAIQRAEHAEAAIARAREVEEHWRHAFMARGNAGGAHALALVRAALAEPAPAPAGTEETQHQEQP